MLEYRERIKAIHEGLGIPEDFERKYDLKLQFEESDLVEIENDIYGRSQRLSTKAAGFWGAMKHHAEEEGVILGVVSAFRSVEKQTEIIQRKIEAGQSVSEILRACAAPGCSEHHSGKAVDLTTIDCEPLSESFEMTEAFEWLMENSRLHSFRMSYPKGNSYGISYEPWHWACYPK